MFSHSAAWAKVSESLGRTDKLENHLNVLYTLLEDVLYLQNGVGRDSKQRMSGRISTPSRARSSFDWLRAAVRKVDELVEFLRRNIQKSIALDALVAELRSDLTIVWYKRRYRRQSWRQVTES